MKSVVLDVDGMSCMGCVGTVTQVLGKIEGVESVDVSLEEKSATLTVEDGVDPQVLADAVSQAGFESAVRS